MSRRSSREVAISLRKFADKLDSIPEMQLHEMDIHEYRGMYNGKDRETFIAQLKTLGSFEKRFSEDNFYAVLDFGAVKFQFYTERSVVCTKRTVKKEVEVTEWDCDSILETALREEGVIA